MFKKLIFLLCLGFYAQGGIHPILLDEKLSLKPNTREFINTLGNELYKKTGFRLQVVMIDDSERVCENTKALLGVQSPLLCASGFVYNFTSLRAFEDAFLKSYSNEPYGVFFFYTKERKIDILLKPKDVFDDERVFFEYMAPLLPKPREILDSARISAIVFNGYSEAADLVASYYKVSLVSNIPRDESGSRGFVKFSMYFMLLSIFGLLGFVFVSSKLKGKKCRKTIGH